MATMKRFYRIQNRNSLTITANDKSSRGITVL